MADKPMNDKKDKDFQEVRSLQLSTVDIEATSDDYVPEGFETVEDYLADMRETYDLDLEADRHNREEAAEDKRFAAGDQWDSQVLKDREGLPCLVVNTIPQFIAQLVGDWRENRNAVKVVPAENGDKAVADIRSDLIRAIEVSATAKRTYDTTFESATQCGDGAFKVALRYSSDDVFDQDIVIEPIDDCLSVVWDRLSVDPTGGDATHCFVDDLLPRKDFETLWPEADPSELNPKETKTLSSMGWMDSDVVRVTEHWRLIERKKLLFLFQDGTIKSFDEKGEEAEIETTIARHGPIQRSRVAPCRYAQMHLVTGFKILAGPFEWKLSRLPVIRMSGRVTTVDNRRIRYGLVRFMKDSVRLRNFWRSVAAEQMGYAPKAQWFGPVSAFEGREEAFRKAHLSRDPILMYNDDAEAPPQRLDPPAMQSALLNEAQINVQDMKDVTGIHDASLGIKSNETSGKAIQARQREGDVASLTYYDNANAAVYEAGKVMNQLIGQIYDGTRIIRVVGQDEATKLVKINDENDPSSPNIAVGRYDVVIDTGPSYSTRRVEAAQSMMDALQVFPNLMAVAGDLIVKAQDWPGAEDLAERLKKTIPPELLSDKEKSEQGVDPQAAMAQQQAGMQAEFQQQMAAIQGELQALQTENSALKADSQNKAHELEIKEFEAETKRLTVLADLAVKNDQLDFQKMEKTVSSAMEAEEREADRQAAVSPAGPQGPATSAPEPQPNSGNPPQ